MFAVVLKFLLLLSILQALLRKLPLLLLHFEMSLYSPVDFLGLSGGVATVVEGVDVFLNVVGDCSRRARVFELLAHLGAGARTAVLLRALCAHNLLLLKRPSCLRAAAVYKVFIKFPFRLSRYFKGG